MPWTSTELFRAALTGDPLELNVIEEMLRGKVVEDLHLDWKSGKVVGKNGAETVRRAVAAFANSNGGVLVLGANGEDVNANTERPWCVEPCPPEVGGKAVGVWLTDVLREVRGLHPLPRIVEVGARSGVWILAVSRGYYLVSVPVKGVMVYPARFGDGTSHLPNALVEDLLHGRRQRPTIQLGCTLHVVPARDSEHLSLTVHAENQGLVDADGLRIGLVLPKREAVSTPKQPSVWSRVTPYGFSAPAQDASRMRWPYEHLGVTSDDQGFSIPPFGHRDLRFVRLSWFPSLRGAAVRWERCRGAHWGEPVPAGSRPRIPNVVRANWKAAAYLIGRGFAPRWFQLNAQMSNACSAPLELAVEECDGLVEVGFTVERRDFDGEDQWELWTDYQDP